MVLYRVVSHKKNARLNGRGAAHSKVNRWNSYGTELIYTSESRELAISEVSSYVPIGLLPDPHLLVIEVDSKALIKEMEEYEYPNNWDEVQPNDRTRILGDQFYNKGKCIGLKVQGSLKVF